MLVGTSVTATDGNTGRIRTFLFDDQSWVVRYMVVEVSHWMQRRDVVLAVSTIDQPNWETKSFRVRMTKQQISQNPDIDTKQPVSLQQRRAMEDYFGPFACWIDYELGTSSLPTGVEYPVHREGDLHLRSTEHMLGYQVWTADSDTGYLEGFVIDETSWHLGFLDVKTGKWLHERSVLVPTAWVQSVSWAEHRIYLHHDRKPMPTREQVSTPNRSCSQYGSEG